MRGADRQATPSIPSPLPEQTTQPLQAPDMEVHHHAHVHEKKKWKEYVFQFFMLFLAVFCGFLAEYQLEHKIERDRAKQFVKSFYEDLKTDTARVSFYTGFDDSKIVILKNLPDCYDSVSKNLQATSCLLNVMKISAINRPFIWTVRTLNQLTNAGGFRLLKKEDADSIIAYQKEFNNFQDFQSTVFQDAQNTVRTTFNQLINFTANAQMFNPNNKRLISSFDSADIKGPVLFTNDKALLNRYFNELELYYRVTYNHKGFLLILKENQIRLIDYFKDKYDFN